MIPHRVEMTDLAGEVEDDVLPWTSRPSQDIADVHLANREAGMILDRIQVEILAPVSGIWRRRSAPRRQLEQANRHVGADEPRPPVTSARLPAYHRKDQS